jgi:hypothetical protein
VLRLDEHWQEHPQVRCTQCLGAFFVCHSTCIFSKNRKLQHFCAA